VVIENVERIMAEEGLPPKEATYKAMQQIVSPIIGITLVLIAVFVPMAFFPGSTGGIYREFSVTLVSSIAFSAFLALTLTPALCATMLRPSHQKMEGRGIFARFNRGFARTTGAYEGWVAAMLKRPRRWLLVYAGIVASLGALYYFVPTSFLPEEDQGYIIAVVQAPPGATRERTDRAVEEAEAFFMEQPQVRQVISVLGFSFFGGGQNAAIMFMPLHPWDEREGPGEQCAGAGRSRHAGADGLGTCDDLHVEPARNPGARQFQRVQLAPPGPHRPRLSRAHQRPQPAARHGVAEPGGGRRPSGGAGGSAAAAHQRRSGPGAALGISIPTSTTRSRSASAPPTPTTSRWKAACCASSSRPTRRSV
jgi:multidrug efflux pump subunit AcrB